MNTIKFNSGNVKVIAHRGLSGIERENTCPAFVAAANRSYFGVETDVHVTKDGKFVIIHDETTERVTLGKINIDVENSNYSELESIVLPDLDGSFERQDIRIPLLSDYIKICKKYEKICVLEVKNHFEKEDLIRMVEEIRESGYLENMIFISFDFENCVNLRSLLPEAEVQWLIGQAGEINGDVVTKLCENRLDLDAKYIHLNAEVVDMLHSKGIKVNTWTVDDKEEAERLAGFGVDFLTTNILE